MGEIDSPREEHYADREGYICIFRNIHTNIYAHITQLMKKETIYLRESKEGFMGGFRLRKGKEEMMQFYYYNFKK